MRLESFKIPRKLEEADPPVPLLSFKKLVENHETSSKESCLLAPKCAEDKRDPPGNQRLQVGH